MKVLRVGKYGLLAPNPVLFYSARKDALFLLYADITDCGFWWDVGDGIEPLNLIDLIVFGFDGMDGSDLIIDENPGIQPKFHPNYPRRKTK